jgi:hypothetical protein
MSLRLAFRFLRSPSPRLHARLAVRLTVLGLCAGLASGCVPSLYNPAPFVGPHLEAAGDVRVGGSVGAHGVQGAAAARLPGGLGAEARVQRGVQPLSNRRLGYPDSVDTRHDAWTLAAGYHLPLPAPWRASLYAGRARGQSEAWAEVDGLIFQDAAFASGDVTRWYVQPTVGYAAGPAAVYASAVVSRHAYRNLVLAKEGALFAPDVEPGEAPSELTRWHVEPTLSGSVGRGPLQVAAYAGLVLPVTRAPDTPVQPIARPYRLGVALTLRLDRLVR